MQIPLSVKRLFTTSPGHDTVIDAIRALAVISTIVFHVLAGFLKVWDVSKTKEFLATTGVWFAPFFQAEKGVDAFFVLSGLVLGLPLFSKLSEFDFVAAKKFYHRRFLRIFPLFLVALIFYHFARKGSFNTEFFANLFFINNWSEKFDPIIPVGWSLTLEMQLYFLVPFFLLLLKKTKWPQRIFALTIAMSFAVSALTLLKFPELFHRPPTDLLISPDRDQFGIFYGKNFYESFFNRFAPFVMGLWLALIRVRYEESLTLLGKTKTWSNALTIGGITLIAFVLFMPVYLTESFYFKPFSAWGHFVFQVFSRQLFSLGLCLLILGAWYGVSAGSVVRKIFNWNIWAVFSKLAFPIYLFHYPCIVIAALLVFRSTDLKDLMQVSPLQAGFVFLLSCALSILLSIPLHLFIEKRFMKK